jgi:hypothetical protein
VDLNFNVVNDGNIDGNVTITKSIEGNGSLNLEEVDITPNSFVLETGSTEQIAMDLTVPEGELPGTEMIIKVLVTMESGESINREMEFRLKVIEDERVQFQMISNRDVVLGPSSDLRTSFEFYIYNGGNVEFSYQMSASASLEDHVTFRDGDGTLDIDDSVSPFMDLVMPNGTDSIEGTVFLDTSGSGGAGSFDISVVVEYPNIAISGVISTDPTEVLLGDEVDLMGMIENTGTIPVSQITCVFLDGDTEIGSTTISSTLDAGEETIITGIKWTPSTLGEHIITFKVDPQNELIETDEEDNTITRTFDFKPDLSIRSIQIDDTNLKPGSNVKASIVIENEGNCPLTDGFIISVNQNSKNGNQLISDPVSEVLDPRINDQYSFDLQFNLPDVSGNLTLFFEVLSQTDDGESDLTDNSITREVQIASDKDEGGFLDPVYMILIIIILLVAAAAGFYIWKFGLPNLGPPPGGDEEGPVVGDLPEQEPSITDDEILDDDIPVMDLSTSQEEDDVPILEMSVAKEEEIIEEEPVVVAEVVEVEVVSDVGDEVLDVEDEGLIPEV